MAPHGRRAAALCAAISRPSSPSPSRLAVALLAGARSCWPGVAAVARRLALAAALSLAHARHDNPVWHAVGRALSRPARAGAGGACAIIAPHGACIVLGHVPDRLGHRYRRADLRQSDRRPEAWRPGFRPARPGPAPSAAALPRRWSSRLLYRLLGRHRVCAATLFGFAVQLRRPCAAICLNPWSSAASAARIRGGLIPGHGGVLDRMDSTCSRRRSLALLVFVAASQSAVRGPCMKPDRRHPHLRRAAGAGRRLARSVTVLGSTGSIGVNTLDVIAHARKIYGADAFPIRR